MKQKLMSGKYDIFWKIAAQFLEVKVADAVTAIDEHKHDMIVHLVTAISVNDLLHQIERKCPPGTLISNDKHRCKVGKLGFPVAAVERGKQVVVNKNATFAVADHNFTKAGIVSSIIMICNIPESIDELYNILLDENLVNKPVLCLYTDGEPDHHCTYTHVQLSYICLFLTLDLDYLVAVRTLPQHS
ncbi:hypothetical protein GLOIN_2v1880501 [Rhizophagus clarus]|uniref:Uncharacterized protein n=1 Tax=Rhizophagus clarus TaxID=94130 RepID=A0A8H3QGI6_9GLOM|nr:hypothetical protein GLOIN_2v1880501 [Rhizophagus clarus]